MLAPEETAIPLDDRGEPAGGHLRLSADAEFMLGLMTGVFGMEKTFLVVPENELDRPDLTSLLAGISVATYDPDEVDEGNAMDLACARIAQAISRRERPG